MCHAEKLVHYLQCSQGLYNRNMTIFTIFSKLLVHLQPNLVWWYRIISQSVQWENGITAFKVKVTAKFIECLSEQYPLNHLTFCYQSWYERSKTHKRLETSVFFYQHIFSIPQRIFSLGDATFPAMGKDCRKWNAKNHFEKMCRS